MHIKHFFSRAYCYFKNLVKTYRKRLENTEPINIRIHILVKMIFTVLLYFFPIFKIFFILNSCDHMYRLTHVYMNVIFCLSFLLNNYIQTYFHVSIIKNS